MGKHADAWMAKMMLSDRGPEAEAFSDMIKNEAVKIIPVGCLHWAFYSITALFGVKRSSSWNYGRITQDAERNRSSVTVNAWGKHYAFDGIVCLLSLICLVLNIIVWFQRVPKAETYSEEVFRLKSAMIIPILIIHFILFVMCFVSFGFGKRAGKYFANWALFILIIMAAYFASESIFLRVTTIIPLVILGIVWLALSSGRDSTYKNEERYETIEDHAKSLKGMEKKIEKKKIDSKYTEIYVKTDDIDVLESADGKVYAIEKQEFGAPEVYELCSTNDIDKGKCLIYRIYKHGDFYDYIGRELMTIRMETAREKAIRTGLIQSAGRVSYIPERKNYKLIRSRSGSYYAYTGQGPFFELRSSVLYAETNETADLRYVNCETGLEAAWRTGEPQTDENGAYVPLFENNYELYIDDYAGIPYIYAFLDDELKRYPCCSVEEVMNGSKKIYNSDNEHDKMEVPLSEIPYRSLRAKANLTGTIQKTDTAVFVPLSMGCELKIMADIFGKPNIYVLSESEQYVPLCTVESVGSGRIKLLDAGTGENIPISSIPTGDK